MPLTNTSHTNDSFFCFPLFHFFHFFFFKQHINTTTISIQEKGRRRKGREMRKDRRGGTTRESVKDQAVAAEGCLAFCLAVKSLIADLMASSASTAR